MPHSDTEWTVGRDCHGFRLARVVPLPALRAVARQFEHTGSGARVLHLQADDVENCFAVIFPTPPPDDTGLPHILEHSVLGGSRKFPVREPFFEMLKMSMATFINAMTAQACTVYPIATTVKRDFYNLADVYLDAVFHPLLTEDIFKREGHHLAVQDPANPASPLTVSGIVYSEMKGAYSAPESLVWTLAGRGLFPDTPLGRDSAGDPEAIPGLTYRQFADFYTAHYHPSNALIFLYGDIPTEEHLAFLAPALEPFARRPVRLDWPRQPRWPAPRALERPYPVGPGDSTAARTFVTLNWVLGDALDPRAVVDGAMLTGLLFGNDAAPLRKALIDSRLGADVFFSGEYSHAHELTFHVGLKGTEPDRVEAFERLVLDTLGGLADRGFTPAQVDAAFQQLAYDHLEITPQFPLQLLWQAAAAWPYGADPVEFLRFGEHLSDCRRRWEADPALFARALRALLLDNPHRLRVVLRPDPGCQARADAAFAARMAEQRARLTDDDVRRIAEEDAALTAAQGVPNPPEALALLPQLQVSDLPPRPRRIPTRFGRVGAVTVLRNDIAANGVNYLEFDVDLAGLPEGLWAMLPRYAETVSRMGTASESYEAVAARRAALTGGLWCHAGAYRPAAAGGAPLRRLRFGLKALDDRADRALGLLGDLLFGASPRDAERLRDVLTQSFAWYRTTLVNDGLSTARRHAARGLTPEAALDHRLCSRDMLERVAALRREFAAAAEGLMADVERIRAFVLNPARWTVSFTGSDPVFRVVEKALGDWQRAAPAAPVPRQTVDFTPAAILPRDGLAAPLKIAHCVQAMPAPALHDPAIPLFSLGLHMVRFDYLLPEVRLKGNAYGAGASYDDSLGLLTYSSYNDPRIAETLAIFGRVRDFVAAAEWNQPDIARAIIGSLKSAERPIRPGEATGLALLRHLRGDTDERRDERYAAALRGTPATVRETTLAVLEAAAPRSAVCVVSSREKLEAANRVLGDRPLALSDLLPPGGEAGGEAG
jgi:Zn-dependent M16 (insulinase) family peptidase